MFPDLIHLKQVMALLEDSLQWVNALKINWYALDLDKLSLF
jgi:hypothetical protein